MTIFIYYLLNHIKVYIHIYISLIFLLGDSMSFPDSYRFLTLTSFRNMVTYRVKISLGSHIHTYKKSSLLIICECDSPVIFDPICDHIDGFVEVSISLIFIHG